MFDENNVFDTFFHSILRLDFELRGRIVSLKTSKNLEKANQFDCFWVKTVKCFDENCALGVFFRRIVLSFGIGNF